MADDTTKDTTQTVPESASSSASQGSAAAQGSSNASSSASSQAETSSATSTASSASTSQTATQPSSAATGSTTSEATASSPLPTAEQEFKQSDYETPIHPEILASKAFKASRFLPPVPHRNYDDLYNNGATPDPAYQWVDFVAHAGDSMAMFWFSHRVPTGYTQHWNPWETAYDYEGHRWHLRILASRLPHD